MQTRYQIGDHIRYTANGVCLVEDIRKMPELQRDTLYYVLRPIADRKSTFFIAVDNEKMAGKLRVLLTKSEIDALIGSVQPAELTWIDERKTRIERFRTVLRECDMHHLLVTVCMLSLRKKDMLHIGKKLAPSDEAILRQAQAIIDNELAFVLGIPENDVAGYVLSRLDVE